MRIVAFVITCILTSGSAIAEPTAPTALMTASKVQHNRDIASLWLDAERESDFEKWQAVYTAYAEEGQELPFGVSRDLLILNIIQAALDHDNHAIALEYVDTLHNKHTAYFTNVAIFRHQGLRHKDEKSADHNAQIVDAMLATLPDAKQYMHRRDFYHWLNALSTAIMDIAPDTSRKTLDALLSLQDIPRHRAYLLHRIALADAKHSNIAVNNKTLDIAQLKTTIAYEQLKDALNNIAIAELSHINPERNKWLHDISELAKQRREYDLAIKALWLIDQDEEQIEALLSYIEWLLSDKQIAKAIKVSNSIEPGKNRVQAWHMLKDAFHDMQMDSFVEQYEQRILKAENIIESSIIAEEERPNYVPFKTFNKNTILFDASTLTSQLAKGHLSITKRNCNAPGKIAITPEEIVTGFDNQPFKQQLHRTKLFTWYVMLQHSRALAGNQHAETDLKDILLQWARANAFANTTPSPQYDIPIKHALLPVILAATSLSDTLTDGEHATLVNWLNPLIRHMGGTYEDIPKDDDYRHMTDALLMAWGIFVGDAQLYHRGKESLYSAVSAIQPDGSIIKETNRGTSALSHIQRSLASLTAIAEMGRLQGNNLYRTTINGKRLEHMLAYFINATQNPLFILPNASENWQTGTNRNVFHHNDNIFEEYSYGKNRMAFAEAWLTLHSGFTIERLKLLLKEHVEDDRPFIDELSGGNASCYYGTM